MSVDSLSLFTEGDPQSILPIDQCEQLLLPMCLLAIAAIFLLSNAIGSWHKTSTCNARVRRNDDGPGAEEVLVQDSRKTTTMSRHVDDDAIRKFAKFAPAWS